MVAQPTGVCWCGCGEPVSKRSFFKPGHDRVAESALALVAYGGLAQMLEAHGYGPAGKNLRQALEEWKQRGGVPLHGQTRR